MVINRYEHDERSIARNAALGSAIECYRCNGYKKKHDEIFVNLNYILVKHELIIFLLRFGHFARDCPTSAGLNRAALVYTKSRMIFLSVCLF